MLVDVLRKILIDQDICWVEALPRALRILHDLEDPQLHLSPYEIVFGRQRAHAGLPWSLPRECPDAVEFLDHMREIDFHVALLLNMEHEKVARRVNRGRDAGPKFTVGDWVWQMRPREVGGMKLKTWWMGPFKIISQMGDHSFRLRSAQGEQFEAHKDRLKPCYWRTWRVTGLTSRFLRRLNKPCGFTWTPIALPHVPPHLSVLQDGVREAAVVQGGVRRTSSRSFRRRHVPRGTLRRVSEETALLCP